MPSESAMGTIRGDFCIEVGRNICHGSDAVESAENEIAHWFPEGVASYGKFMIIFITLNEKRVIDLCCRMIRVSSNGLDCFLQNLAPKFGSTSRLLALEVRFIILVISKI